MKKTLVLALFAVLSASSLWADQLGPDQHWIEKGDASLGLPASSDVSTGAGFGFGGAVGYRINEHFSISAASGYYQYDINNVPGSTLGGTFSYVPLEAVFNYNIGDGDFRPYASFGIGVALNTYALKTPPGNVNSYETSFLMSPAIGLIKVVSPQAAIFIEGRMDMDYRSNGVLGMGNAAPSIFIPIQGGLVFFVI
jgi:hypothetical protein